MKKILSLLTLALLGASTTASAGFYYEYYKDPGKTEVKENTVSFASDKPAETSLYNTVSYSNFEATRFSDWGSDLLGEHSNFYYIHPLGKDVDLFLTDRVNSIYTDYTDALFNNIVEYGYRKLEMVDGKYVPVGKTVKYEVSAETVTNVETGEYGVPKSAPKITNPDGSFSYAKVVDTVPIYGGSNHMDRYQYKLGTFSSDDVIELYMKDADGNVSYSYSDYYNTTPAGDSYEHVGASGAFGDGDQVSLSTDFILWQYYYQDANLTAAGLKPFGNDAAGNAARDAAANKSMPLSALDLDHRVFFGILGSVDGVIGGYKPNVVEGGDGSPSGQPLPGGVQVALIAGLFGLGFWYVRRRKAVTA